MDFQVTGLPLAGFSQWFGLSDAELARFDVVRQVADKRPGFPCRISLRDAEPGESVLLLNYEHLPVASPYRSRYAIFVRENAVDAHLAVNEIPEVLQTRLLSLRAFDDAGLMRGADVVHGHEMVPIVEQMLSDPKVQYIHVHNAKPGCFAARIDRA